MHAIVPTFRKVSTESDQAHTRHGADTWVAVTPDRLEIADWTLVRVLQSTVSLCSVCVVVPR